MSATCVRLVPPASTDPEPVGAMNPRWISALLADLRHGLDAHGHVGRIARTSGVPYETVKDQLHTQPRHRAALLVIVHALRDLQQDNPAEALRLFHVVADQLGYTVSERSDHDAQEPHGEAFARAVAEVGDVARAYREALPGGLDDGERAQLDREAVEAIAALHEFRAAIWRRA